MVFLHQHRSAGSEVKQCLSELSRRSGFASSPDMTSDQRQRWDAGEGLASPETRNKLKFHRGLFVFGMCDSLDVPCSYFTMLRDPMSRAASSYAYCKQALGDEMCSVVNANEVSLREWVLHHGSLTFTMLLYRSDICNVNHNATDLIPAQLKYRPHTSRLPCWYKHKVAVENMDPVEVRRLTEYVVENLQNWFSVVGIVEEFADSMRMFEHVYKFPFTKCKNLSRFRDSPLSNSEDSDNNSNRSGRRSTYDDNDPDYIQYDPEVKRALEADYKIYRKAKALFNIQKQFLFNTIKR